MTEHVYEFFVELGELTYSEERAFETEPDVFELESALDDVVATAGLVIGYTRVP